MDKNQFDKIKSLFYDEKAVNILEKIQEEISFNSISKKDVRKINSWINSKKDLYKMEKVILFHGTSSENKILEEGIKKTSSKTKKSIQSQIGYVCLSMYPDMAKMFGELAYPYSKEIKIYAVHVPVRDLKADLDQLNNKRLYGENENIGNTLADSFIYGNGCRIKRNVHNYEVKDVTNIFYPKNEQIHDFLNKKTKKNSKPKL